MSRLKEFLGHFTSASTRRLYGWALAEFFGSVYGEEAIDVVQRARRTAKVVKEEAVERYFVEERNYKKDVRNFLTSVQERTPKSRRTMLSGLRSFFLENDIELGEAFWKRQRGRIKGSKAVSKEKTPDEKELRRILTHQPLRGRTLFSVQLSGGMRIGEAIGLLIEDVDLETEPTKVFIRGENTRTGEPRITFISKEASDLVKEWKREREEYLKMAVTRSTFYDKQMEDKRLFPFDVKQAYVMWNEALDRTGLNGKDVRTNRHKIHPHTLRKFFRAKAGAVSVDMAEALMGHKGYLTEVYRRYPDPEKALAEFYLKVEPSLTVFGAPAIDLEKVREEMKVETKGQIDLLKEELRELRKILFEKTGEIYMMPNVGKQIEELKEQIEDLVARTATIKEDLDTLERNWKKTDECMKLLQDVLIEMVQKESDEDYYST